MYARDELAAQATPARDQEQELKRDLLDGDLLGNVIASDAARMARTAIQRGWSKPRTVNSATELDALKPGTVLRFPDGEIGMIMVTHDKRQVIGYPGILPTAELADASQHCFGDGITVLFTPGDVE